MKYLVLSGSHDSVMADQFTKWVEGYAMPDQTAETVATNLVNNFVSRFGCPRFIHTDQGRQFEGEVFKNMCARLGVEKTRTTPYHPASNGQVECYNRTLLGMLRCRCSENPENGTNSLLS